MNPAADNDFAEPEPAAPAGPVDRREEVPAEPAAALDFIFQVALEAGHPAIDEGGIATMKGNIESGRFSVEHYIKLWTGRLEGMTPSILV